jgi:hypothetical protein
VLYLLEPFRFRNKCVINLILDFVLDSKKWHGDYLSRLVHSAVHFMFVGIVIFFNINFVLSSHWHMENLMVELV